MLKGVDWQNIVRKGRWFGGYPEIALRMLLKAISDRRTFNRITHKPEALNAKRLTKKAEEAQQRILELQEKIKDLKQKKTMVKDLESQEKISREIKNCQKNISRKQRWAKYRKSEKYRAYQREYKRKYRMKRKEQTDK